MALYTQNPPHPTPLRRDDIGKRHQNGAAGNALRAAVFGVNDGLVSNAALIYGVAGAAPEPSIIVYRNVQVSQLSPFGPFDESWMLTNDSATYAVDASTCCASRMVISES